MRAAQVVSRPCGLPGCSGKLVRDVERRRPWWDCDDPACPSKRRRNSLEIGGVLLLARPRGDR